MKDELGKLDVLKDELCKLDDLKDELGELKDELFSLRVSWVSWMS